MKVRIIIKRWEQSDKKPAATSKQGVLIVENTVQCFKTARAILAKNNIRNG
jgi:hypothetical protein